MLHAGPVTICKQSECQQAHCRFVVLLVYGCRLAYVQCVVLSIPCYHALWVDCHLAIGFAAVEQLVQQQQHQQQCGG